VNSKIYDLLLFHTNDFAKKGEREKKQEEEEKKVSH
jgi:hypothetical protein